MANPLSSLLGAATTGVQAGIAGSKPPSTVTTSSVRKQIANNQSKLQQLNSGLVQAGATGAQAGAVASNPNYNIQAGGGGGGSWGGEVSPFVTAGMTGASAGVQAGTQPYNPQNSGGDEYNGGSQTNLNKRSNINNEENNSVSTQPSTTISNQGTDQNTQTNQSFDIDNLFGQSSTPQPSQPSQSNLPPVPQAPDVEERMREMDAQLAEYNKLLDAQKSSLDETTKAMVGSIQESYNRRRAQMEEISKRYLAGLNTANMAAGLSRYAPQISDQILSTEERAGIQKLADLDSDEKREIMQANIANQEKNFQLLDMRLSKIDAIRKEKSGLVQQQFENSMAAERANRERQQAELERAREERESSKFKLDQAQKLAENVAPNILEMIKKNPNQNYSTLITQYANQYGVDPIALSGSVLKYRTEYEKQELLNSNAVADILAKSSAGGTVEVPGVGKVTIMGTKEDKAPQTLKAGGKIYQWSGGKWSDTGISDQEFTNANILSAAEKLSDPAVRDQVLRGILGQSGVDVPESVISAESKLTKEQLSEKNNIIQNIRQDPDVKGFVEIRDSWDRVQAAATNPSPASDISLVYGFMKMNDPGSVVREGEFATAENAGGVSEWVRNYYNKLLNGERLTTQQRNDFVGQAKRLYEPKLKNYQSAVDFYKRQASDQNIPFDLVMRDFTTPTNQKTSYSGISQKIQSAVQSGYKPDEIINYLKSDPSMSAKITAAQQNGYSTQEILQKLSTFNSDPSTSVKGSFEKKYPEGAEGGQCASFARKLVDIPPLGNGLNEKKSHVDKIGMPATEWRKNPQVGDVVITNENPTYGHVFIVNKILPNKKIQITESNYKRSETVSHDRVISLDSKSIYGAIRRPLKV